MDSESKKAVFILGAGSSVPFRVPTLLGIFKDKEARSQLDRDKFLHQTLSQFFWAPRGHDLDTSDLSLSVEEILTLIRDYEKQAYGTPRLPIDIDRFRRALYVLIKKAVYDHKNTRGRHLNTIIDFARHNYEKVTWASFNWDCIFEASYYYSSCDNPLYGRNNPTLVIELEDWKKAYSTHTFLKLHGAINWWYDNDHLIYLPFGKKPELNNRWSAYEQGKTSGQPVILEPSYYKYQDAIYKLLFPQWEHFVRSLLEADLVVILGYSLPEADFEARRALTIGFQSNERARFIVVDSQSWVCDRYYRLFGRTRLTCVPKRLEDISPHFHEIVYGSAAT